jgi:hypothetical protein
MPDNDIVPRSIRPRWRKAGQFLIGWHEPSLVGHAVDQALTEAVKAAGLPSPLGLVQRIRDADLASDTAAFEDALEEYSGRAGGHDIGMDVVSEACVFYELRRADLHARPEEAITRDLVVGALRRHAVRSLLGSEAVADKMIATGRSRSEIDDHQQRCLDEAQYGAIADQVLRDRSTQARTPASQVRQPDLAALLETEI